ncbi:MAG: RluA family pseudouridine synthase [Clostridiales bacterium]|nr:RluA family pseudouridine synthase [Clostridiales bacterium]
MKEVYVKAEFEGSRLDKLLFKHLNNAPKSLVFKLLRKKTIKLNGKRAAGREILKEGDIISLFLSDETYNSLKKEIEIKKSNINFDIVYEDHNILIADKPFGMLTQADRAGADCLNQRLLSYVYEKGELKEGFVPSVCNRLDRNTGGLVAFGKTYIGARELSLGFKEHFIEKYYFAVVKGVFKEPKTVKLWHIKTADNRAEISAQRKEGAKETVTEIYPVKNNGNYTLLKIKLITGKTHQIRAVLSYLGYPIIGDLKYGDKKTNLYFKEKYGLNCQFLYCGEMIFNVEGRNLSALKPMKIKGKLKNNKKNIIWTEFGLDL